MGPGKARDVAAMAKARTVASDPQAVRPEDKACRQGAAIARVFSAARRSFFPVAQARGALALQGRPDAAPDKRCDQQTDRGAGIAPKAAFSITNQPSLRMPTSLHRNEIARFLQPFRCREQATHQGPFVITAAESTPCASARWRLIRRESGDDTGLGPRYRAACRGEPFERPRCRRNFFEGQTAIRRRIITFITKG